MNFPCSQVDCADTATHLVLQMQVLDLLFKSGAGYLCEKHALEYQRIGGVAFKLTDALRVLEPVRLDRPERV